MAIIYSYPIVQPTADDLLLGTDLGGEGKPTKNFTIQSIVDLLQGSATGLGAVITVNSSAKDVNGANQSATDFLNISGTGTVTFNSFSDGTMSVSGGVGTGFVSITSTDFDGDLTGIVKAGSSIQGTVTGVTQALGTNNTTLATTAFVMNKVDPSVLQYLGDATGPFDLNLVTDDFKISGTANQIETTATTVGGNVGTINLKFPTTGVTLPDGSIATTQAVSDNSTKVATTAFVKAQNNALDLDFTGDTGTSSVLLNSQALDLEGTTNQIVTAVTAQKVKFSLPSSVTISGTYTGATFAGDLLGTVNTATTGTTQSAGDDSTKIATTAYVDAAAGAKLLQYQGDTGGPFDLNLKDDDLDIAGGSNISTTAATVTGNLGVITINLNDSVTISGTSKADTFTTTAGTATWVTTVLDGFTAITSDLFTGPLAGNASSATALASSGAISITGDTTSTGGPHTYTSGGAVTIPTTIADTTVTGKVLTNLPTPSSAAIAASDTILAAMAKLQGQITGIPQGLIYKGTWNASTNTPTLASGTGVTGEFYIVSVAGTTNLDGITDWQVGDWAIFVEVGATDTWQKIDNTSAILGSGTANKIAKWTGSNTLATGLIADDGTTVTVGNSGNFIVEGNTTLGNADTDTTTVKGPAVFEEVVRINEGISLGANTYGTAGQVLTSGGGAASVNTWTTPTTGSVTSVGLTETGNALTITGSPITTSGTINIAGAGSASQYINGELNLATFPIVDNYVSWTLAGDTGSSQTISSTNTATFAGGFGISTVASATDTLTAAIDITGTDNAIAGLTAATPIATDTLWFNDISDSNTIRKATIADIVDLGNETLAEVLVNGNTTGGTDIAVSAGDDITFTDTSKAIFGAGSDLQIYSDGTDGYIVAAVDDLVLRSADDIFMEVNSGANAIKAIGGGAVELYHNNMKTFETESNGVNIDTDFTYSRISLKGSGTTYGTVQGDSTNGLLLRSGGNSNQGLAINGYNSTFLGLWGGGVAGTVMKIEGFFPKVEIGDSTNFGNGNLTDLEVWGDVDVKGKITGSSSGVSSLAGRKFAYVSKALTVAGSWTDMFSLSGVFIGVISEVFGQCNVYGSITKSEALSYHVAQAGGTSGSVANTPVYNKIIDTGPGSAASFELQFLAFNASNNKHGYKCQARALTANSTVDISVNWMDSSVNNHTFTDLT